MRWKNMTPGEQHSQIRWVHNLAHQNRTIAIASDCRVDAAKSERNSTEKGVLGSEIAARNRKLLATFLRNPKIAMQHCSLLSRKLIEPHFRQPKSV